MSVLRWRGHKHGPRGADVVQDILKNTFPWFSAVVIRKWLTAICGFSWSQRITDAAALIDGQAFGSFLAGQIRVACTLCFACEFMAKKDTVPEAERIHVVFLCYPFFKETVPVLSFRDLGFVSDAPPLSHL